MKKNYDDDVVINVGSDTEVTVGQDIDTPVTDDPVMTEPAATYPASDDDRIGVTTDEGTDPVVTDQGDEQEVVVAPGDGEEVL